MQQPLNPPPFLRTRTAEELKAIVPNVPDAAALSKFLLNSDGTREGKQTNMERNLDNLRVYHKPIQGGVSVLLRPGAADGVQLFPTHVAAPSDVIHVLDDFSLRKAPASEFEGASPIDSSVNGLFVPGARPLPAEFPYFTIDIDRVADPTAKQRLFACGPGSSGTPLFLRTAEQGAQLIGLLSGCLLENPSVLIFINVPAVYHVGLQLGNFADRVEQSRGTLVDESQSDEIKERLVENFALKPADVGSLCFALEMNKVVLWNVDDGDIYDDFVRTIETTRKADLSKLWVVKQCVLSGDVQDSIELGSNILKKRVTTFNGAALTVPQTWSDLHDPIFKWPVDSNKHNARSIYAAILSQFDDHSIDAKDECGRVFWGATAVRWLCNNEEVNIPGFDRWLLLFSNIVENDIDKQQISIQSGSQTHAETLSMRWILWKTAQLRLTAKFRLGQLAVEAVWMMDQTPRPFRRDKWFPCPPCEKDFKKFSNAMSRLGVKVQHPTGLDWFFAL